MDMHTHVATRRTRGLPIIATIVAYFFCLLRLRGFILLVFIHLVFVLHFAIVRLAVAFVRLLQVWLFSKALVFVLVRCFVCRQVTAKVA